MGEHCVFFLSQDDKARVPLGLPAAHKQAPILMHLEYEIRLPDHDWVIAESHKLIPSVYAACEIKDSVTYSGPTFIAIRSAYHDSSIALTHGDDFNQLTSTVEFADFMCVNSGTVKLIVMVTVDGGPDENPRYPKVLAVAYQHFKKYDLDALFIATNAPGHSAYNAVERRMAPLSHDLAGLILPHDTYGTHLDTNGKIIDHSLASSNFEAAGKALADVWSKTVIGTYPVVSEYFSPVEERQALDGIPESWKAIHVRQSQYCLQIVRCSSVECCGAWRTNLKDVLVDRFLPAPIKFLRNHIGVVACEYDDDRGRFGSLYQRVFLQTMQPKSGFKQFPFDYYCSSVHEQLAKRICNQYGLYFSSQSSMKRHLIIHNENVVSAINDDPEPPHQVGRTDSIPVLENIFDILTSPFTDAD